jgi:ABC-2 type transport system permease protein
MSAADLDLSSTSTPATLDVHSTLRPAPAHPDGATPPRFSTRLLRSELWLIFGRRRNWAGLAVLASVPVLIAVAVKMSGGPSNGRGPDFFASITDNGIFVALAALGVELGLFLPIAISAISADTVAGEANLGTLRYLLAVPVARTRLLVVKYLAVTIFAFVATLLVAVVGTLVGLVLFGGGPATLLSGTQVPFGEALLRLLGVCAYLSVGLCALGAIGVFVSTLTEQPIGATIATVMLCVASFILDAIPQVAWLHPYLLTHSWLNFGDLLRDPVAWDGLRPGLVSAAAYIVIFWSAAWARFGGRDVTS